MKTNDLVAFVYYTRITNASKDKVTAEDVDTGEKFEVKGKPLLDAAFSADDFNTVEKVTHTQIAEQLVKSHNRPLTVKFTKKDGSPRTLRGRLMSSEQLLGRSYVEDLDTSDSHRTRLVDHRTISELIVGGVQYLVKK